MKRKAMLLIAVFLLLGTFAWAELELGLGIAPPMGNVPQEAQTGNMFGDATKVIHAGWSFWWLFYASYDGFILPPYSVAQLTSVMDTSTGSYSSGYYRPGFLNTFNLGIRPRIGPISVLATVGINQLYVYKQGPDGLEVPPVGVNLRLGAGLRFANWIGVTVTGTTVFADFAELSSTLNALGGNDPFLKQMAQDRILNNLFPAVLMTLYL
jgi:hypothetical protein